MLSQSRKENEGIQSHHCLLHFAFSIHGNLAYGGVYPSLYIQYAICKGLAFFPLILWLWVYFKSCVFMTLKKSLQSILVWQA